MNRAIVGNLFAEVFPLGSPEKANPYDTSRRDYTYSEKFVLFDLVNDPGESTNLYDKEPQVVAELKTLYKTWKNKK
jgi:hypothetical protein